MKRIKQPRPHPAAETRSQTSRCLPSFIELAIGEVRDKVGIGITLSYCLYLWSCFETEKIIGQRDEQLEDAIRWADKTQITSLLLVVLHSVHAGLDTVSLQKAEDDSKYVLLEKWARKVANGSRKRKRNV